MIVAYCTILILFFAKSTLSAVICDSLNPFPNYRVLDETELSKFNLLSQPCTAACTSGYFGDFCDSITNNLPATRGPWNSIGYFVDSTTARKTALDTSDVKYIQYSSKEDGAIIGLRTPTYSSSALISISLFSKIATPILFPHTPTGSLDAIRITRSGEIYLSRSDSHSGPFNIAIYEKPGIATKLFTISERVVLMEIFLDKGMNTTIMYTGSSNIIAYFPNGQSTVWAISVLGITGLACGWGCPNSIYFTVSNTVKQITSGGIISPLITDTHPIYCLASVPSLNTIFYLSGTEVKQASMYGTGSTQSTKYNEIITGATATSCSLDISDSLTEVLLVQSTALYTQSTLQLGCPYKQTTKAITAVNSSACISCPDAPDNGYILIDSVSCDWECSVGYTKSGSLCIQNSIPAPCPAYHRFSISSQTCVPSAIPWAMEGQYVQSVQEGPTLTVSPITYVPYLQSTDPSTEYNYMSGNSILYFSKTLSYDSGALTLQPRALTSSSCSYHTTVREDYIIKANTGVIWLGFNVRDSSPTKHCLWMITPNHATKQASITNFWQLSGKLCSVDSSGEHSKVFALLCTSNYILQANYLVTSSTLTVLAGKLPSGYRDGPAQVSLFNAPSSILYANKRLYVADKYNCVIREIDIDRQMVYTSAGQQGVCIRKDSTDTGENSGLAYPTRLFSTPYDGYIIFFDKYINYEGSDTVRQFHTYTHAVRTVMTLSQGDVTSALVQPSGRIVIAYQANYHEIYAKTADCPAGFVSLAGNALSEAECLPCEAGKFSSKSQCLECTNPSCGNPWQVPVQCTLGKDSYCGNCTNKPSTTPSVYIKSGTGVYGNETDCGWAYLSPCPIGYFLNSSLAYCLPCPDWSTTSSTGSTSISQCTCLGGGSKNSQGTCVVPSVYKPGYAALPAPFSILPSCDAFDTTESPSRICPCQPGEYISQFYPKICSPCPDGLHSPDGVYCRACPSLQEPSLDKTTCRCSNGLQDIDYSSKTVLCACEQGKEFKNSQCTPCPSNHFHTETTVITESSQSKLCSACAPGTEAQPGSTQCTACLPGWLREDSMPSCNICQTQGHYATDPTSSTSCQPCLETCNGRRESPCPTSPSLFVCSDCPAPRQHASFNQERDCATSCDQGHYEKDGECTACTDYTVTNCPVISGFQVVPCSPYADSECRDCLNLSKPLYYSQWGLDCTWTCIEGYKTSKALPDGSLECVKEGSWSLWDLFTI